jgi:hypothetical protein
VVSRATYPFKAAVALAVDSVCNGSRTATTPELILLRVTQSAADGLVEEPAAVELAGAEAEADVAGAETDADVAGEAGVELDDELDEVQPAMRAPLAAKTARTVSDERRDISGTSMGWNTNRIVTAASSAVSRRRGVSGE